MRHLAFAACLATVLLIPAAARAQSPGLRISGEPLKTPAAVLHDVDNDGDLDIVIARQPSPSRPAQVLWLENDATQQFPSRLLFDDDALLRIGDLDLCDCDGDGRQDYVVADRGLTPEPGQLALYQRQPDDSFVKWTIRAGADFDQVEIADIDGNGTPDVVAVGFGQSTADVYFNDGNLNFDRESFVTDVDQMTVVAAGDIDGDGDIDVAVGSRSEPYFKLFRNQGNGTFDVGQDLTTSGSRTEAKGAIVMADLNDDGTTDLLTFASTELFFLNGAQNFAPTSLPGPGSDFGGDLLVADIDQNGRLDIIAQRRDQRHEESRLEILYQDDPMDFSRREILENNWDNRGRSQMVLGDLDDDSDLDLVFPENGNVDDDISWFENINGRLYRHMIVDQLRGVNNVEVGDVSGNGRADIVATLATDISTENEVIYYENRALNEFIAWRIDDDLDNPADLELGDVNGDGNLDVIATGRDAHSVVWYEREGPGWSRTFVEDAGNEPRGIGLGDVNGDGNLDVVLASFGDDRVFWYENDGTGAFTRRTVDASLPGPVDAEVADLDDDGDADIVVGSSEQTNALVVYLNDDDGSTFTETILDTDRAVTELAVGDWTTDGIPDLIVGYGSGANTLVLFENDGTAKFTPSPLVEDNAPVTGLELADLDGDGDLDLVLGRDNPSVQPPGLRTIVNENGTAGSALDVLEPRAADVFDVAVGDFGDGALSIVAADGQANIDGLLLFQNADAIPVELTSFAGTLSGSAVQLAWTTASETNNTGFAVLRTAGDGLWSQIAFVEGAGTTAEPRSYRFTDRDLPFAAPSLTYRLKQVDVDGTATLTDPITIQRPAPEAVRLHGVFPNPAPHLATIRYELSARSTVHLALYDVLGRRIRLLRAGEEDAGRMEVQLETNQLAAGMYFVRLQVGDWIKTERLTIVR